MLLGADYTNAFLQDKFTIDAEVVWHTTFGWVLSGGSAPQATTSLKVAYIKTLIEALWEIEQLLECSAKWPAFPMSIEDNRYTVGLLWKGEERPADNRQQALATADALPWKFHTRPEDRDVYDAVLLGEYQALAALEAEPKPDSPG